MDPKAGNRALRMSRVAKILDRLTKIMGDPRKDVPTELLDQIIKRLVQSPVPRWDITTAYALTDGIPFWAAVRPYTLDILAAKLITTHEGMELTIHRLIHEKMRAALLKTASIRIPADIRCCPTVPVLNVSPALAGGENKLRRLELLLPIHVHDYKWQVDLGKCTAGMASMRKLFPMLEVSIFFFELGNGVTSRARNEAIASMVDCMCHTWPETHDTPRLEQLLLDFINALLDQGPGNRRFIRFNHKFSLASSWLVGPLVRVNNHGILSDAQTEATMNELAARDGYPHKTTAEWILDRAHRGPTRWGTDLPR